MTDYAIDPIELSALIASRVCHDLISPVGAIVNGLEVLEEEHDESLREFARDLVQKSARQASAKLQFARLAFGASGSAGSSIDMTEAARCAAGLLEREKSNLEWEVSAGYLPKSQAKLLMNLLLIALNCAARGGVIRVAADIEGEQTVMRVTAEGDRAKLPSGVREVLTEGAMPNPLDAHAVQPLYAALMAREAGMAVTVAQEENRVILGARSAT